MVTIIRKYANDLTDDDKCDISLIIDMCFLQNDPKFSDTEADLRQGMLFHQLNTLTCYQFYLAVLNDQVVGLAEYSFDMNHPRLQLSTANVALGENVTSVAVLPSYRNQGIATQLLQAIIEDHGQEADLVLNVHAHEEQTEGNLLHLYKKNGFVIDEEATTNEEYYLRRNQVFAD